MLEDRYRLAFRLYPYERSPDQDADRPVRHAVVVMGGGPIGVAMALDLGLQGVPVVVLDDHEGIGLGSRAICFAKRCLEIADRYGCGEPMLAKGVVWNLGKVFHRDRKVFEFNLLPEAGHKFPAFINLQQPYFEKFLVERLRAAQAAGAPIEIRGKNRVEAVAVKDDHVVLEVTTPDGPYRIEADWLIGCDGANSPLRGMLGLDFEGRVFKDRFLIADIRMQADFPTERWFWFEPSFTGPAPRRCCTSNPTTPGGSISRSAGTSTARRNARRRTSAAGSTLSSGRRYNTRSSGRRSTPSSASAWSGSAMAG